MVCDLRGCARAAIRHRGINLRSRGAASRRPADTPLSGTRTGGARWGLARKPVRSRALLIRLLERGLLLRRRRRRRWRATWHPWGWLGHLVLGSRGLLILGGRLGRQTSTLAGLTGHYSTKNIVPHADGGRGRTGRRTGMLRGGGHAWLGSSASGLLKLAAQQDDLFIVPMMV